MNILISCDEKYIKYAPVLLESIFENNNVPIHIFLVYKNSSDEKYKKLKQFVNTKWNHTIEICSFEHINIDKLKTDNHFPLECYYTLFPQLFLPENVDRILYLDIDTIVDRNLKDFYEQDFEENYLIACGQNEGFKKSENMKKPGKFGYFNSGVILYNIKKMRKELSLEYYDYVLSHSNEFFFDQGMLNHLFYKDTKYAETMLFNFRSYIAFRLSSEKAKKLVEKREVYIYHYTCNGMPYKPWDFLIEDNLFFKDYKSSPFESAYFYISEDVNSTLKIWWEYAKKTPFYESLYNEMIAKRDYLSFFDIYNRINKLTSIKDDLFKSCGALDERQKSIISMQQKMNISYLEAINLYYNINTTPTDTSFNYLTNIKDYFRLISCIDNVLLIISCKDNCDRYFEDFTNLSGLKLSKPSFRESYIAVVSKSIVINEIKSSDKIIHFFEYDKNGIKFGMDDSDYFIPKLIEIHEKKSGLVTSKGFDKRTGTSLSEIVVNNIDYSMNMIGLNCILIDVNKNIVIDSFNVNTHSDEKLKIIREKK